MCQKFDDFLSLGVSAETTKKHSHSVFIFHYSLSHLLTYLYHTPSLNCIMPGPDPRKTKPSAYTIPKAKPVTTRPPLHSGASTSSAPTADANPRPISHQEVRRGKQSKPPVVTRSSARLSGTRRSPGPAYRARVANLKRPDKYDPKSAINLKPLGSKPPQMVTRHTPSIPANEPSPGPALTLSDSDDDVLLLNDFTGEDNDESIEAIQEAIDQMGVAQPDSSFQMAVNSGSEYAYLLAGTEEEKKQAENLIQQVHTNPNISSKLIHHLTTLTPSLTSAS